MCGPTPPPWLAQDIMRSSSRASGTKRKRSSISRAAATCRSSPCTSSVQPGPRHRRQRAPRQRPRAHAPAAGRAARRGATRRRRCAASANSSRRGSGGATPGQAWRTSSGFFCQCRRMKAAGDRPPSRASGAFTSMPRFWPKRVQPRVPARPCAIIPACRSPPPASSRLTWKLDDAQNRPIDELTQPVEFFVGGDDLLAQGRGSAGRARGRRRGAAAARARARLRRLPARTGVLRGPQAVPRDSWRPA